RRASSGHMESRLTIRRSAPGMAIPRRPRPRRQRFWRAGKVSCSTACTHRRQWRDFLPASGLAGSGPTRPYCSGSREDWLADRTSITFLGAARTVTGSKFLLRTGGQQLLVDCGMFQGQKAIRERNWQALPVKAETIDAVVLTHAHLDHCGYLPRLVRQGFRGRVFCTAATASLARIVMADAAKIQEEDAERANRK